MKKVTLSNKPVKRETAPVEPVNETPGYLSDQDTRIALIQALIALGLAAVADILEQEVEALCGVRHRRKEATFSHRRWGAQGGSVYLADQKARVSVPRVRDVRANKERPLISYQKLQTPAQADEPALRRLLKGLSARSYEACARMVPETFGLSASSVSRCFVKASAARLSDFQNRRLEDLDLVALFIDGTRFADEAMLIGLGVSLDGRKIPLGFEQTVTENEQIVTQFLNKLVDRGLCFDQGLLVVIDGAKGLYKAVKTVFSGHCLVQRWQWHKRENVLSYLARTDQARFRRKLQEAYNKDDYEQAKADLLALKTTSTNSTSRRPPVFPRDSKRR